MLPIIMIVIGIAIAVWLYTATQTFSGRRIGSIILLSCVIAFALAYSEISKGAGASVEGLALLDTINTLDEIANDSNSDVDTRLDALVNVSNLADKNNTFGTTLKDKINEYYNNDGLSPDDKLKMMQQYITEMQTSFTKPAAAAAAPATTADTADSADSAAAAADFLA